MIEYCSWCLCKTNFTLLVENKFSRNQYGCLGCGKKAVQCKKFGCSNMAQSTDEGAEHFCAEHNGVINSFERLGKLLVEISEYESIFRDERIAVKKYQAAASTAMMFLPGGLLAMAAIKGAGTVYRYRTQSPKGGLSAKQLVDESLALLGGGVLSNGVAVLTAVGNALGTHKGGAITNAYFREIDHFSIKRVKTGDQHGVIFINGFLSEQDSDAKVWEEQLAHRFLDRSWYHLDWEASSLKKLGLHLTASPQGACDFAVGLAKTVTEMATNAMSASYSDFVRNPWHTSMVKAQMAGALLADAIARTPHFKFTLVGHSLGARVIYFALKALSSRKKVSVEDVFLLGGAVGGGKKDAKGWRYAEQSVNGRIYNCLSKRDAVLAHVYTNANLRYSDPIGYVGIIQKSAKIVNADFTDLVESHTSWRQNFGEIHRRIAEQGK